MSNPRQLVSERARWAARRLGFVAAAATLGLVGSALTVQAHPASDWYGPKWTTRIISGVNTDRNVNWRFVQNFPSGSGQKNRLKDGAQQWTALNTSQRFNNDTPDFDNFGGLGCSNTYQQDKVGWEDFGNPGFQSSEPLAVTAPCVFASDPDALFNFKIKVNNDAPWFSGTGDVPSGRFDMWSMASHEFGHAAGRLRGGPDGQGHWAESNNDLCPDPLLLGDTLISNRHTMCPVLFDGTSVERSLATHDQDTHRNAY